MRTIYDDERSLVAELDSAVKVAASRPLSRSASWSRGVPGSGGGTEERGLAAPVRGSAPMLSRSSVDLRAVQQSARRTLGRATALETFVRAFKSAVRDALRHLGRG